MPTGFNKQKEGLEEFEKAGVPYEDTADDRHYDEFDKLCKNSIHNKERTSDITKITLVKNTEGEFLVYSQMERCQDNWGSPIRASRTTLGKYPIPVVQYGGRLDSSGKPEKYVVGLIEVKTGYSIKRSSAAFKKLEDIGTVNPETVQCIGEQGNKVVSITSYEDMKNGTPFDELMEYGKSAKRDFDEKKALRDTQRKLAEEEEKELVAASSQQKLVAEPETSPSLKAEVKTKSK